MLPLQLHRSLHRRSVIARYRPGFVSFPNKWSPVHGGRARGGPPRERGIIDRH